MGEVLKMSDLPPRMLSADGMTGVTEAAAQAAQRPAYMEGYIGIGDNFWQRPFIKEICTRVPMLYLQTFTPQVYWDIKNIKFIRPKYEAFKSHIKDADRLADGVWSTKPLAVDVIDKPSYWAGFSMGLTLTQQFQISLGTTQYDFSFPVKDKWIEWARDRLRGHKTRSKKICVVHFPTVRDEWKCPARDPKPEYLQAIVNAHKKDYFFISLADLDSEHFITKPRNMNMEFHRGELSLEEMMGLLKIADMAMSGNCYLFPMALAIGTKTMVIGGGCQDIDLFLDQRMNLDNFAQVKPDPFCNCLKSDHDCNKEIDEQKVLYTFNELSGRKQVARGKLLVYKIGARYHPLFRNNRALRGKYDLLFEPEMADLKAYIKEHNVSTLLTTHFPPGDLIGCGADVIYCEAFLGREGLFDRVGYHFTPDNEIRKFVDATPVLPVREIPNWTKIAQPADITRAQLFAKYRIEGFKQIVIMGQEAGDKSLIYSHHKSLKNYEEFLHKVVTRNLDTTFIYKPHPVYSTTKQDQAGQMAFMGDYKNVIMVNESLGTLFGAFDRFVAFSSTTIFEGLARGKKFATAGCHLCDDERLTLRIDTDEKFQGLFERLGEFAIDEQVRARYMSFILNYYAIPLDDPRVLSRITRTSEQYFKGGA